MLEKSHFNIDGNDIVLRASLHVTRSQLDHDDNLVERFLANDIRLSLCSRFHLVHCYIIARVTFSHRPQINYEK